jgi:aspartate kinase
MRHFVSHDPSDSTPDETPVVMKFGGSSVADLEHIRRVASVVDTRARSRPVVVVVSAMGGTTDDLVQRARALSENPAPRELDMLLTTGERTSMALLAIALHDLGRPAISLTGSQCGIITDHRHGRARIVEVRPFRIGDELAEGHVVIVGGFAGVSYKREVTTLGRGGSDTTAVALAAALGADCEIYSDVDGIYTGDPRSIAEPRRLSEISFETMRAMARAGAKVLHAEAVRLAEAADIRVFARAADGSPGQTVVTRSAPERPVTSVARDSDVRMLTAEGEHPDGLAAFASLAAELGLRDVEARREDTGWRAHALISQTHDPRPEQTLDRLRSSVENEGAGRLTVHPRRALVSVIGAGLESRADVMGLAIAALRSRGLSVDAIVTDTHTIGFLVAADDALPAERALHAAFLDDAR